MNKAKENQACELILSAQRQLNEANTILNSSDDGDVYHIVDKTLKRYVDDKPTFTTAKNAAIDYLESNTGSEVLISKWVTTIKK